MSSLGGGGEVLILGGTYELTSPVSITTSATESASVIIKPADGAYVKFNFGIRSACYASDGRDVTESVKYSADEGEVRVWANQLPTGAYWVRCNDKLVAVMKK